MKKNKAFTLVELIIVIAIIAILAVTAFLLLTKRLAKARDASRSSNLANIENALQISLTDAGTLPKPDNYTLIYSSGTTNIVGYQGDFGEGAKDSVGNINSAPKDGDDYFLYYLSNDLKSYQLGALMENEIAYNSNVVSAVDYSSRYINVKGSQLGMLFDSSNSPINKLGLTGVDIQNTTSSYTAYFDNSNKINGTGFILKSLKGGGNLAYRLVGYWSFDEGNGSIVHDSSGNGNDGTLSGSILPVWTGGYNGSGMYFKSGCVIIPNNNKFYSSKISIFLKFNTNNYNSQTRGGTILDNGKSGASGGGGFVTRVPKYKVFEAPFRNIPYGVQTGSWQTIRGLSVIPLGQWNNIAIISDGDDTYLYQNGIISDSLKYDYNSSSWMDGKRTKNRYLSQNNGQTLKIGACDDLNSFDWTIDDIRIYDRALTESEVKALYNATK